MVGLPAFSLLLMPFILSYIFLFLSAKRKGKGVIQYLYLDDRALFRQPLLWLVVFFPVFYAFGAAWINLSGLSLELSRAGIDNFFDRSKHGIFLLAPIVPLGILVARMHSSLQTEKQIKVSEQVNSFNAYYKHVEEFQKMHESIARSNQVESVRPIALYRSIFPKNTPSSNTFVAKLAGVELWDRLAMKIDGLLDLFESLSNITASDRESAQECVLSINNLFNDIWTEIGMRASSPVVSFADGFYESMHDGGYSELGGFVRDAVFSCFDRINDCYNSIISFSLLSLRGVKYELIKSDEINKVEGFIFESMRRGHLKMV